MVISFIGHSVLPSGNNLREKVRLAILENVPQDEKVLFYCGGYGAFDLLCAEVCRELKDFYCSAEVVYVTPYFTLSKQKKMTYSLEEKLYDSVLYPPLEAVPPKYAIRKRNEWMVLNADLIFSYVTQVVGGARKTLEFAKKKKKGIVDLNG